jgi:hypothetical protein
VLHEPSADATTGENEAMIFVTGVKEQEAKRSGSGNSVVMVLAK